MNGTDKAALIAGYAKRFEAALIAGGMPLTGTRMPGALGVTPGSLPVDEVEDVEPPAPEVVAVEPAAPVPVPMPADVEPSPGGRTAPLLAWFSRLAA